MKLGVFLERDGILNAVRVERGQAVGPLTMGEFQLETGVLPLLEQLKGEGFLLFATTNQPGLSRGSQSRRELDRMHQRLRASFPLDEILVCPHDEEDMCPCRKPKPGMLFEAAYSWHLNLEQSFVVSDKWQDAEAARSAGCTSVMRQSPWNGKVHRDFVVPDLARAVEKILAVRDSRNAVLA